MTTRATRTPRRRTSVALLLIFAIIAAFTIRLIDIQVVKADEYTDDFRNARLAQGSVLYGTRGEIVDMDGRKIDKLLVSEVRKPKDEADE